MVLGLSDVDFKGQGEVEVSFESARLRIILEVKFVL